MAHEISRRITRLAAAVVLVMACCNAVVAADDFYAGKTIRILAGFAPGGSIDARARIFARNLPKFIPGSPTVIVENMTGAGGVMAANYVYAVAEPNGLTILHFPSSTVMNIFLRANQVEYDIRKMPFLWVQPDSWVTVVMPKTSGVKSVGDLAKVSRAVVAGGTGVTSLRSLRPKVAMNLFGAKYKWVTGYRGTTGLIAAAERGEIDLMEMPLASYFRLVKPMVKMGRAVVLFQTGLLTPGGRFERSPLLPDVPTLAEVLPKDKQTGAAWQAWQAAVAPQSFQAAVAVGPNVPTERLATLSKAFGDMSNDPTYRSEYERSVQVPADAKTGVEANAAVQVGLKQLFEQYQEGVEYLKKLPQNK